MCYLAVVVFAVSVVLVNTRITVPTEQVDFRAELHMSVGAAHAQAGRLDEAEHALRGALKLDPQYPARRGAASTQ